MSRELKEIGPQADGVGEQQLTAIGQQLSKKYLSTDDTDRLLKMETKEYLCRRYVGF